MSQAPAMAGQKRKADALSEDQKEIEVDLDAPEPPSKKALRKAKKTGIPNKSPDGIADGRSAVPTADSSDGAATRSEGSNKKRSADYGIWIGNLTFSTTKDSLTTFFTKPATGITAEDIARINLPKGSTKNGPRVQNKGFAYIDFSTPEAQKSAMALSEELLDGRRVLIKGAKNFEGRPDKVEKDAPPTNPSSKRVFIGNLGFDVTADDLRDHFARCGSIETLHMATFQDSGKCKGYAWITFEELAAAEAAAKGWVDVMADMEEEELSDDEASAPGRDKKSKTKRIYVNRLQGRKLRMEFAEDASTRYKKRFGKEGRVDAEGTGDGPVNEKFGDENQHRTRKTPSADDGNATSHDAPEPLQKKLRRDRQKNGNDSGHEDTSRYGKTTVQRLTGAAVQGQGKKVTFD